MGLLSRLKRLWYLSGTEGPLFQPPIANVFHMPAPQEENMTVGQTVAPGSIVPLEIKEVTRPKGPATIVELQEEDPFAGVPGKDKDHEGEV